MEHKRRSFKARKLGIMAFLGVILMWIVIPPEIYAQHNKKEVIERIQELQNTPTTPENLPQRSQEIKQLLRLLEQKEGREIVEQVVSPELKQRFRRAEQSGDYLTACEIADEIIANLLEFVGTIKGKSGAEKSRTTPTDGNIVKFKAKDEKDVYGYLLRPAGKGRFPAIVLVHGGISSKQATLNLGQGPHAEAFNKEGYVTLAVDYRSSEFGGKEIDDVIAAVAYLKSLDFVDAKRIGLFGSSHGAYMSLMAATELGGEIKAVVENFAFTNLGRQYYDVVGGRTSHSEKDRQEIIKMGEEYYGGSPKESPKIYKQISPVYNVSRIQSPVLIIHGKKDQSVLVYQANELRDALEKTGKIYEIKIYEDGPHGFIYRNTPEAKDALKLAINFFNKYLKETNKARTDLPNEEARSNSHQKALRGKITYVSLEGGFYKLNGYVLVSEDKDVVQKIKKLEGKLVEIKGRLRAEAVSIFMSGTLFEVEEVTELSDTKGSSNSPFGIRNIHKQNLRNEENLFVAAGTGAGIVRWTSFFWGSLEPEKGKYDWDLSDSVVKTLLSIFMVMVITG